jgi:hypothetical protein
MCLVVNFTFEPKWRSIMSRFHLYPPWWWRDWPPLPVQRDYLYSVKAELPEPNPSPWKLPVPWLLATISLREVASTMPEGKAKSELGNEVDAAIFEFVDGCGTRPPGWWPPWLGPWPVPGPGPDPGPYLIASELARAANTVVEGTVRNEILRVAGQIVERASGSTKREDIKIPSDDEIDEMTAFPSPESQCQALCIDLVDALVELKAATKRDRPPILARLRALREQMRQLNCRPCHPS